MRHLCAVLFVSASLVGGAACGTRAPAAKSASPVPPVVVRAANPPWLAGCYALFNRAGRPAAESLYWAPSYARLDSGGAGTATALDSAGHERGPRDRRDSLTIGRGTRSWHVDSLADTVRLLFHSGFSGTEFLLGFRRGSDTLRGRAVEHWDFGPPFETNAGQATAVRIPCRRPGG
jgi:hypothetical protein